MERKKYPLLYFQLKKDAVLGILVGTEFQVIDKDLRRVKNVLRDYLQKQYKKYDSYPGFNIKEPRLKVIRVNVRPTFRENTGSFPMTYSLRVPVPVVYGQVNPGYFECFLPLFEQSFYYYEANQFEPLVRHFATNILSQLPPERIHRFVQYGKAQMDEVSLRVNLNRDFDWRQFEFRRTYRTLNRLAEQYPYSKNVRKSISALPEAAWEMEDKVLEVIDKILNARANVLIVGNPGVGKSAVLQQAIRKISQHMKRQQIRPTFWRIMPQRITASAQYLGEWEEAVESLVEELQTANGVLWVIDLIQLLQSGGSGPEDSVASFLMSYLLQGKLQILAEATPQELESMRQLLPGFVEHFQLVHMEDPPQPKVQAILDRFTSYARQNLHVHIREDALSLAYRLLQRYYPYESFPGKGIQFLGQCINEARLNRKEKVDKELVITHFTKQTGLPELFLRDDLLLDTEALHHYFSERIIGQPEAVRKLCEIVKIFKAGLNNPHQPINTLLFAGPTGVGKTASAKALAEYFFGQGQKRFPLVRIDMSEFQHPSQISRLIGTGREVGQLVKDIRERPFTVLLLDEVEKADRSIFDALLTVLDEGMLTDAYGRITNFRNAIIIMTTNLGASNRQSIGYGQTTSPEAYYHSAISRYFRPEFINRIDGIILFRPLDAENIRQIARKELAELKTREGFRKRNLQISFTEQVADYLAQTGFDERYGARPLQRAIEQTIVNPIAKWLLDHPNLSGEKLTIDYRDGLRITRSV